MLLIRLLLFFMLHNLIWSPTQFMYWTASYSGDIVISIGFWSADYWNWTGAELKYWKWEFFFIPSQCHFYLLRVGNYQLTAAISCLQGTEAHKEIWPPHSDTLGISLRQSKVSPGNDITSSTNATFPRHCYPDILKYNTLMWAVLSTLS